jgi:hypothetical protein
MEDVRAAPRLHEDAGAEGWELYRRWRSECKEPYVLAAAERRRQDCG